MIKIFFLAFLLILQVKLYGQTTISLIPYTGVQQSLHHKIIDKGNLPNTSIFRRTSLVVNWGGTLQYKRNDRAIALFFMQSDFTYHNTLNMGYGGQIYNLGLRYSKDSREFLLFPISLDTKLDDPKLRFSDADNFTHHLLNFKLTYWGGLTYNRLLYPDKYYSEESQTGFFGDTTFKGEKILLKSQAGISAIVGITFQFMHKSRERLAISVYYNQGFVNLIRGDFYFRRTGYFNHKKSTSYRGSAIGATISWPIKVYSSLKKAHS
jgi:hypothetical protein